MDITERNIPSEHRFEVTASMSDTQYQTLRGNAVDTVLRMLVDRLVDEFLPDVRTSVQAKLDYDAIARSLQAAIQARLLEESLKSFGAGRKAY